MRVDCRTVASVKRAGLFCSDLMKELGTHCPELRTKTGTYIGPFLVRKLILQLLSGVACDWSQVTAATVKVGRAARPLSLCVLSHTLCPPVCIHEHTRPHRVCSNAVGHRGRAFRRP